MKVLVPTIVGGLEDLAGADVVHFDAASPIPEEHADADVLVGWGMVITGALGFAIGFRAQGDIASILFAFVLMLVAGYAFTWVFITIGLVAGNAQAAQGLSMLVIPFSFISSANVPVSSMPGWMQPMATLRFGRR